MRLAGHSCPTVAGAYLMARAALAALYPDQTPERGAVSVEMPSPEEEGTTGVIAQVLTLITGAAADNGFKGLGGHHARNGLLRYSEGEQNGPIVFRRRDTGAAVEVELDLSTVPPQPQFRTLLMAVLQDRADTEQRATFAVVWQERVRRLLLEHADDDEVVPVRRV